MVVLKSLQIHTDSYESTALHRVQTYRFLLPDSAATPKCGYSVLFFLHGFDSDSMGWLNHTRVAQQLSRFGIVSVFPQGDNGWYTNSYDGKQRFEDDIMQDFVPHITRKLPIAAPGRAWGIGGMSMGGYGAVKLALKHPETFGTAFSHAGAMERMLQGDSHPVFGGPITDSGFRRSESPIWLVEQIMCRFPIQRPMLYLDCGLSDPLLEVNRRFSDHLKFLGYHHQYHEAVGHHTWPYWNRAFRTVLPALAQSIGAEACQADPSSENENIVI